MSWLEAYGWWKTIKPYLNNKYVRAVLDWLKATFATGAGGAQAPEHLPKGDKDRKVTYDDITKSENSHNV